MEGKCNILMYIKKRCIKQTIPLIIPHTAPQLGHAHLNLNCCSIHSVQNTCPHFSFFGFVTLSLQILQSSSRTSPLWKCREYLKQDHITAYSCTHVSELIWPVWNTVIPVFYMDQSDIVHTKSEWKAEIRWLSRILGKSRQDRIHNDVIY